MQLSDIENQRGMSKLSLNFTRAGNYNYDFN